MVTSIWSLLLEIELILAEQGGHPHLQVSNDSASSPTGLVVQCF